MYEAMRQKLGRDLSERRWHQRRLEGRRSRFTAIP